MWCCGEVMSSIIAIIDYGIGNVKSIFNALKRVGATPVLTNDTKELGNASGLILPGVGAFGHGMNLLHQCGLVSVIEQLVTDGKPILGICLGMQLFMDGSEEFGYHKGLGLVKGMVKRLDSEGGIDVRLPHVGWNELEGDIAKWRSSILEGTTDSDSLYFVHSYACEPSDSAVALATSVYGNRRFCSSLQSENIFGCQFHPEKSGEVGLNILRNFVTLAEEI